MVTEKLKTQDLPDDPVYLTLDIVVEYCLQNAGRFPTYREIGKVMGELKDKPPVSTERVSAYLRQLELYDYVYRVGRRYYLKGGNYAYNAFTG